MAKKVLLVDDDKDFVTIIRSHIIKGGYDVEVATNGQKCLKKARHNKPDVILLDVMMPGQNGFDVCKKLKSDNNTKNIPVILLTAYVKDVCTMIYKHRDLETEADDYLEKPVDPERLLKSINDVINNSNSMIRKQGLDSSESKKLIKREKGMKYILPLKKEQLQKKPYLINDFVAIKAASDGTKYLFRPIKYTDNELLLDFCNSLTEESVAFPFFQPIKTSPQEFIRELKRVDYSKDMALGVFIQEKSKENMIGIGHYKLIPKSNKA